MSDPTMSGFNPAQGSGIKAWEGKEVSRDLEVGR